ncbi:MAG: hypothetical protein MRY83_09840 [Flavobacteriales bacterium]|nr:hypothetical protein [Flavobacteriales bacterium]
MKKGFLLFIFTFCAFAFSFGQKENPARVLAIKQSDKLVDYLTDKKWSHVKNHVSDPEDGDYDLFKKKGIGGGTYYLAVHKQKFMHYQIFFSDKNEYSFVLSYDDLLEIPEGKSTFNQSIENDLYAIKSVTFEDPHDIRNKNIFFGKVPLDHAKGAVLVSFDDFDIEDEAKSKDQLKKERAEEEKLHFGEN